MRIIAHVDMDAFYASVERRHNPALRDRPVVVGADPRTAAAARRRGGQLRGPALRYPLRHAHLAAWKLASRRRRGEPAVAFVHGNRKLYVEVSERVMASWRRPAMPSRRPASTRRTWTSRRSGDFEAACERANALKREIAEREGLTCSVGLGPNKLVAKIASDFKSRTA